MIAAVLEFLDLLIHQRIHIFLLFFIYVWVLFLVKYNYARKYRPFNHPYRASTTVIIPVLNERLNVLKSTVRSLVNQTPGEFDVILVVDKKDPNFEKYRSLRRIMPSLEVYQSPKPGKRPAVYDAINRTKAEIVVLMDSDTQLVSPHTIANLIKPFVNPRVGGVTTAQRINMNPAPSLIKRFADWMESMRCHLSFPAMSVKGVVGCLPGRCIAFRRRYLMPYLEKEFLNETFRGKICITGDDRCLTNIILRHGYDAVFQSTAPVITECPSKWGAFLKQQLRWIRSSRRETVTNIRWYLKKPLILPYIFLSDIIVPFFWLGVLVSWGLDLLTGFNQLLIIQNTFLASLGVCIISAVIGMLISLGLRQIPHLRTKPKDILILPLYILFLTAVMTPLCIYGFLTMDKQEWMTR